MERATNEIPADESPSSGANLATAMKHLVGVCLQGIGGCRSVSDVYNEFVTRFGVTKSDRLYWWVHGRLRRSDFVTVSEKDKGGHKSPPNFYTLNESKFEAFLQQCGIYRSEEHCLQIVSASLTHDRHAIMAPARKQILEVPSSKLIAMTIDCLENECGGSSTLALIAAAVAARLNLPAENAGRNSTIYRRVKNFLHNNGRFQSTGTGRTCTWTVLERPKSQEQERPQLQKRALEISSDELITTMIDCLENECGGTAALAPIVAAVVSRLNLPAENVGKNSTIYCRVQRSLRRSGRFQSTGMGRTCTWTMLGRPIGQEQERSRLQKRVLEIPSDEFITTMIDCLENECGGSSTLAPIVTAVATRLNLPAEHAGRSSTIYKRVQRFLSRSGRFQSTGTGCASTWTVLKKLNSQEWSQPAVNAFLRRVRKREQKNAAAERQKSKRQREMAELERKVKELEIESGNGRQQNVSDGIDGLSDAEIKFNPETGCLVISMESGRIRQLVATSSSTRMAISTANGLPAVGARILDNGAKFRPEWSGDRKQLRLSRQNDIDELLQGD